MIVGVVIVYSFLLGILSNFPLAELGGAVFAEIQSANIVGYQNARIVNGLNLLSIQLDEITSGQRPNIDTMFEGCIGQSKCIDIDTEWTDGDEILTYENGVGYDGDHRYFFYKEDPTKEEIDDPENDYHWLGEGGEDDGVPATYIVPAGQGFFYWRRGATPITLTSSGAVTPNSVVWTIKKNINILSNPFPVELPIDTCVDWHKAGAKCINIDMEWTDGDEIMTYENGVGYDGDHRSFFYKEDPTKEEIDDPENDYHWLGEGGEDDGVPATYKVPAGGAFFYWRRGDGQMQITVNSPVVK